MKKRNTPLIKLILCSAIGFSSYLIYKAYLLYPQRFEVNKCVQNSRINEIYQIKSPAHRDISFKDHWFFGPMIIETQVIKPNPNTNRSIGDKMFFDQDDKDLSEIVCP